MLQVGALCGVSDHVAVGPTSWKWDGEGDLFKYFIFSRLIDSTARDLLDHTSRLIFILVARFCVRLWCHDHFQTAELFTHMLPIYFTADETTPLYRRPVVLHGHFQTRTIWGLGLQGCGIMLCGNNMLSAVWSTWRMHAHTITIVGLLVRTTAKKVTPCIR
jgi:hypothetical protein